MSEVPEPDERRHAEEPAEGRDADAADSQAADRAHTQEPSEGATGAGGADHEPARTAGEDETGHQP